MAKMERLNLKKGKIMKIVIKGKLVYHVVIVGNNNEPLLSSETYFSKGNAVRAANKLAKELKIKVAS